MQGFLLDIHVDLWVRIRQFFSISIEQNGERLKVVSSKIDINSVK